MNSHLKKLIDDNFAAVAAKDLDAALAAMADDAVLYDPHYPTPTMTGKSAIASGFRWVFSTMKSMRFDVERYFFGDDGRSAAVEVSTHHVLNVGGNLDFRQVFVVETDGTRITRWTAYEPYGPNGGAGIGLKIGHFFYRLSHRGA
jgi:ketosteroid isomerase-like protein